MLALRSCISVDLVEVHKLLSELLLGSVVYHSLVLNRHLHSFNVFSQLFKRWQFISLAREGVTDSLDLISSVCTIVEGDDID